METFTNCIAPEHLQQKLKAKEPIVVIDVRSKEEYDEQHIPGAVNIPLPGLEKEIVHFSKHLFYVTACGKGGGRSAEAAELILKAGYASAWLCNGTQGWFVYTLKPATTV